MQIESGDLSDKLSFKVGNEDQIELKFPHTGPFPIQKNRIFYFWSIRVDTPCTAVKLAGDPPVPRKLKLLNEKPNEKFTYKAVLEDGFVPLVAEAVDGLPIQSENVDSPGPPATLFNPLLIKSVGIYPTNETISHFEVKCGIARGSSGDFPFVCAPRELERFLSACNAQRDKAGLPAIVPQQIKIGGAGPGFAR